MHYTPLCYTAILPGDEIFVINCLHLMRGCRLGGRAKPSVCTERIKVFSQPLKRCTTLHVTAVFVLPTFVVFLDQKTNKVSYNFTGLWFIFCAS